MTEENKEDFELEWMFAEYGAGRVVSEIAKELGKSEGWDKEGIIYADVNPAAVPQASQNNPWYTGRRSDLRIPFSLWQQMCFKGKSPVEVRRTAETLDFRRISVSWGLSGRRIGHVGDQTP